jgi:hypothetical protein
MNDDTWRFLTALYARCTSPACITLTAIHPTENRPVPSRHIPLGDAAALHDALERLHAANAMGWGAYYGLATRRPGLTRWQRGDMNALVEIPAIIADIDEPPAVVLPRIRAFPIPPSCIIRSGHGIHLLWLLRDPTTNKQQVNAIHRGLAQALKGDYLTTATAIRLPGSQNTKYSTTAPCEVQEIDWSRRYQLADFAEYQYSLQRSTTSQNTRKTSLRYENNAPTTLNPHLIQEVTTVLLSQGFKWRETWLNGPCPHANQHKHADRHPSFGFNTVTGNSFCFVCGSMVLNELRKALYLTS